MNESYASQASIPLYFAEREPEYAKHVVEKMMREGSWEVFKKIFDSGTPIVVETHMEEWSEFDSIRYALHYRLTAVRTRNVVWTEMPVFTFTNHEGKIEWKCPACTMINPIEATYCGEKHKHVVGCGRPRDEVRNGSGY